MTPSEFFKKVSSLGSGVKASIDELQNNWGNLISLRADFKGQSETIYDCYPYLFQPLFSNISADELHRLSIAGRLFATSIFLYDDFLDKEILEKNSRKLFSPLVIQWESQKILNRLFQPESLFWERLDDFYKEHIAACAEEESFREGKKSWAEFTEETGLKIAVGKNGISRAVIAGLVELSGNEKVYHPLIEAINNFNIACQILDDLVDWKQDLKDSAPSILLARIFKEKPLFSQDDGENFTRNVAKLLYYKGHAQYTLTIGLEAVEKSLRLLDEIEGQKVDWQYLVLATKAKLESLAEDFESIIQQNIKRVQVQPKVDLKLPPPANDFERVAYPALDFVVEQWRKGFGEARHIMNLAARDGFSATGNSQYHYGDVFQRALILETFCDIQEKLNVNLEPIIDYEIDYLLQKRRLDKVGGWAYFPDVFEIAADADDLGQVLQSFVLADRKELALTYCEKPLRTLLQNNLLENGAVETWIVPKNNRDEIQDIQQRYNERKWGVGPDTEVVANLFYGLVIYDPNRFSRVIKNAVSYLESVQNADGSWDSRWYYEAFYGTFVCARLIAKIVPDSAALAAAEKFLIKTQNTDGGWGAEKSDQLNTSLALLALANCPPAQAAREPIISGINYLKQAISAGWEPVNFIKPRLGEPYKSQTITAMYICKAAAAWNNLPGDK
jgi:hypothetical protein